MYHLRWLTIHYFVESGKKSSKVWNFLWGRNRVILTKLNLLGDVEDPHNFHPEPTLIMMAKVSD